MATQVDYYELLEVSRTASADEIKKAYRKMAMKYHPDRNPGDEEAEAKFKDVNQAYDVLKDEQKRAAYDRFGHAAFEGGGGGGPGGFDFSGFGGGGLGDIFEQMFGDMMGGRRGGRARTGSDIQTHVEITLEEAFSGVKKDVRVITRVACESCHGTGSNDGATGVTVCPSCHGAGKVRAQQGFFVVERPCPTCHGTGKSVKDPCKACHGAGTVEKERTIGVQIPAGVEDGTRIRISGEGEAGQGVPPGDLYVHVSVSEHSIFQRDGANVYCRVPLRMGQAALGTEIEVPVIDGGRAKVKIPAGTQTGEHFRLRGKGFSVLRSSARGDMYIQVTVETPQHLNKRQRELLEEFEKEAGENVKGSPEHSGFFARVRDFFENKS
ncbi:molecular chaperone DnaJ [Acetobacter senegalensis]|uniref:Chaperone protein DnaJ n=1 Tax=Acetobacter senegalensis TaxID=446692 RepID=A0A149U2T9_9PROT|nr:molecular chaperone DnaJ [Acetobacter senegalensis]KXV59795.1 molecular chaperone DnaJ [Acetobacter senegalensis]